VIPAEDGAEDRIQFVEKEPVGHGEDADDHGTPVAENGSKNPSFEWGKYAHSLRLGRTADPRLSGAPVPASFTAMVRSTGRAVMPSQ
jgi:hypothetical protein